MTTTQFIDVLHDHLERCAADADADRDAPPDSPVMLAAIYSRAATIHEIQRVLTTIRALVA